MTFRLYFSVSVCVMALFLSLSGSACFADNAENNLGSPFATATGGRVLPNPQPGFEGVIGLNALESKPYWPPRIVPPQDAPNIILIMTDDVGFAAPSTFGGVIPTPTLDLIASEGLRYTNFHSTALCSPTRAALLTGRNHHSVGAGVVAEQATGFPGYNAIIGPENATIGRILLENGYRTAWFGKNHNTPDHALSQAGPFDQWPTGLGFEHFYGFNGGETSQWQPSLISGIRPIYPFLNNPQWNLVTAMADEAISWMNQLNSLDPAAPFFVYYAPGATHAPHHPTPEWIAKIRGLKLFDDGWNALRDKIFANQKRLGVIPPETEMTDWPDDILKKWDLLDAESKKLFVRQVEVYAAYLAYTDHEIGRVLKAVDAMGKRDNTIIIFISGDNGASAEGTLNGTPNEGLTLNGIALPVADQMKWYDAWGTDQTYPHYAAGWAWAFDTPFKWTKQVASYFGGTRQGMVMSWPAKIKDKGGVRNQFSHVIDIVPTLLEAIGIPAPNTVNGTTQKPIQGTSLVYTFNKENAEMASRHHTQYFEMFGMRGLYHDGWMLSAVPINYPWNMVSKSIPNPATAFSFELYNVAKDWSQARDLAASQPNKLREMQDLLLVELTRNQALPLDASLSTRAILPRPSLTAGRTEFVYKGVPVTGVPRSAAPELLNTSYSLSADIIVPEGGGEGVIVTAGGRFGGYGLYLLKGKPVHVWNLLGLKQVRWEGPRALPPGRHVLSFDWRYEGVGTATLAFNDVSGLGRAATGTLKINGDVVAEHRVEQTIPILLPLTESFDVGSDTLTPISEDYRVPFTFNGQIERLTIKLDPPKMSDAERTKLEAELAKSLRRANQ